MCNDQAKKCIWLPVNMYTKYYLINACNVTACLTGEPKYLCRGQPWGYQNPNDYWS